MFIASPLYERNRNSTAEIVVNQGGTSSGKTYSIMQVLCDIAIGELNARITVAGQDIPNLKVGAMRDMETIVRESEELQKLIVSFNQSARKYTFTTGSFIEFNSYDDAQDAKSGKRDYLFVNEANGIHYNVYQELQLRTMKRTFLDYNPNAEFWVHRELIGRENVELIISDHRHNPFIPQKLRDKIERLKEVDIELWKVYARGLTGRIEGLVFKRWKVVPAIPAEARFIGYGLDFGFSNDPTCFMEVYELHGELWVNELIYETGLTNQDIAALLKDLGISKSREIIADSAEPKSIEEISRYGYNIRPAEKGADSIMNSIDILKRYVINITQRSHNARKEFGSYRYKTKKDGTLENKPVDFMNHFIDPLRYVALMKLSRSKSGKKYRVY
jgi:phage terminase large subunit